MCRDSDWKPAHAPNASLIAPSLELEAVVAGNVWVDDTYIFSPFKRGPAGDMVMDRVGREGKALLDRAHTVSRALDGLVSAIEARGLRNGRIAVDEIWRWCSTKVHKGAIGGEGYVLMGSLLANDRVLPDMDRASRESGHELFEERLVRVLTAGRDAGGHAGGHRSACLIVDDTEPYGPPTCASISLRKRTENPTPSTCCAALSITTGR